MAYKYDLRNKKVGKLLVKDLVPIELRPTHGNCCCVELKYYGSDLIFNRKWKLYSKKAVAVIEKLKLFLASSKIGIDENFIQQFDFEKFLFLLI